MYSDRWRRVSLLLVRCAGRDPVSTGVVPLSAVPAPLPWLQTGFPSPGQRREILYHFLRGHLRCPVQHSQRELWVSWYCIVLVYSSDISTVTKGGYITGNFRSLPVKYQNFGFFQGSFGYLRLSLVYLIIFGPLCDLITCQINSIIK